MPPNTESQPALPPNITFTQFFTKLLIKVPQVDIEKLPSYLLRDHLVPDKDYIGEHDEDKEDDIYSLEHQENLAEFDPTVIPAKFIKTIKLKKLQSNRVDDVDPHVIEIVPTVPEKEKFTNSDDDDSFTCTEDESGSNCFEEESLDLTVSDEFTEECVREQNLIVLEEDEKESFQNLSEEYYVPDKSKNEDGNLFEKEQKEINVDETVYTGQNSSEVWLNLAQDEEAVEKIDICQEDKQKDPISSELEKYKEDLSNEREDFQRYSDAIDENMKNDSNKRVGFVENDQLSKIEASKISYEHKKEVFQIKDGMNVNKDDYENLKEYVDIHSETNKKQEKMLNSQRESTPTEPQTVSSMSFYGCCLDTQVQDKEPVQGKYEKDERNLNENNDEDIKETENNKRQEQIASNQSESIPSETETSSAVDCYGCCLDTKIQDNKPVQGNDEKELAIKKAKSDPPALKIRIFKGNTGELINKEEYRRAPKRKKKIKDHPMKMIKLAPIPSRENAENDTQSRIIQELPGCNWLEQKIRNCGNANNLISQPEVTSANHMDALLETESDDDHLVVDDQAENSEVTTSVPHVENYVEEIIIENEYIPMMKAVPKIKRCERSVDVSNPTQHDLRVNQCGKLMDNESMVNPINKEINETHPFKYMLGNLMKKMDDNKPTGQQREELNPVNMKDDNERSLQNKIKTYKNGLTTIKKNEGIALKQLDNKRKIEESKELSFQTRPAENNRNKFEQCPTKLKPIKLIKAKEGPKEKQADQGTHKTPTPKTKSLKQSYERRMEEAHIIYMNAQNLHYEQQMLENKKLKEQLVRDIEDLKNTKIKEMEDLIEIKTKKEQTMTDLEELKSEILKNKAFLISLKKINVEEYTHKVDHKSSEIKPMDKRRINSVLSSGHQKRGPRPYLKRTSSLNLSDKHLPDLVNHEKMGVIEKNEQIQNITLSPDYLTYLQRSKDTNSKRSNSQLYQAITYPPYHHNNQAAAKQHIRTPILQNPANDPKNRETVQPIPPNNSRPNFSNEKTGHQQHVNSPTEPQPTHLPPTIANDQNSILARHFNSQQFCPTSIPVNISSVGSSSGMMRIQSEDQRKSWEITASQNIEGVGFLRPGEFSRDAAATSPTEVAQFMNSSNRQYSARSFVQTLPITPNQQSHNRQGNIEIQSALASPTVSNDMRDISNIRPVTQRRQNSIPQADNPIILSKCGVCSKVANFLCSGCQKVYYCTVQCQRNHWLGHYAECRGTRQ